ncbi:MAG: hypothetical protein ACQEQE_07770 [Bacillota bacterium]
MKVTDLVLIFIIFTFPFLLILRINEQQINMISYKKMEMNQKIDSSAMDAALYLDNFSKDKVTNKFFESFYINLNIDEKNRLKSEINNYFPVIAIIKNDGFYIKTKKVVNDPNGFKKMINYWTPKFLFTYTKDDIYYKFFIDDNLIVKKNNKIYKGLISTLEKDLNILDKEKLINKKREVINKKIQKKLNFYLNEYNKTGNYLGLNYNFYLPKNKKTNWINSIKEESLIIIFQGMKIGNSNKRYNLLNFSGASISKNKNYIVKIDKSTNEKVYHRYDCNNLSKKENEFEYEIYYSKYNCAKNGAKPCTKCILNQ